MKEFGEKIQQALEEYNNNPNNFIWKGPKRKVNGQIVQDEIKLVDATEEQLKQFYQHCVSMLNNTDKDNPGRKVLLSLIQDQSSRCNTELYLRWLENKYLTNIPNTRESYPRFLYNADIRGLIEANKDTLPENYKTLSIRNLTEGVPMEFRDVPIGYVLQGSVNTLGLFDNRHLSLNFITKLGVWLSDKEMNDLLERDASGKVRNRMDVIKERLNIKNSARLRPNENGLSYAELRAMLNLKNRRYSEMTTDQLVTLRDKVLFWFEDEIKFHIQQWEQIMQKLEIVAKEKGYTLT